MKLPVGACCGRCQECAREVIRDCQRGETCGSNAVAA
jgi:bacterioferritin-associated ferredoxin